MRLEDISTERMHTQHGRWPWINVVCHCKRCGERLIAFETDDVHKTNGNLLLDNYKPLSMAMKFHESNCLATKGDRWLKDFRNSVTLDNTLAK